MKMKKIRFPMLILESGFFYAFLSDYDNLFHTQRTITAPTTAVII